MHPNFAARLRLYFLIKDIWKQIWKMYNPDSTIVFIYAAITEKKKISVSGCQ